MADQQEDLQAVLQSEAGIFTGRFAVQILEVLSPYVTLYCSAQFLNELTAARRREALLWWVLLILGLTAVMGWPVLCSDAWMNPQTG